MISFELNVDAVLEYSPTVRSKTTFESEGQINDLDQGCPVGQIPLPGSLGGLDYVRNSK